MQGLTVLLSTESTPFQLLDLGFEEEQIVDALLKHDNDRDKALEELIA